MQSIFEKELQERPYYLNRIKKMISLPMVKVITWHRRVWKSSLLIQTLQYLVNEKWYKQDDIFYMNKEYPDFDDIATNKELTPILINFIEKSSSSKVIAIDEIQEIENREKSINGILSKYEWIQIFITGSNSHLLSGDLATLLAWRYVEIPVYPLTYDEAKNISKNSDLSFLNYIHFWGLPEIYFQTDEDVKKMYLQSVYNTVVMKDIHARYMIKNQDFFENLYKYIFKSVWNIFSAKNISDYLKSQKISISVNSVLEYLKYWEQSFIINKVKSQDIKTKKIFSIYNKYYVWDLWIRNCIVWYDFSDDIWGILENYVYLILKKYWYSISIGRISNKEIDFIAEKSGEIKYFQVATSIMDDTTREREYSALESIQDNRWKYVVSMDMVNFWTRNWIKHILVQDLEKEIKSE